MKFKLFILLILLILLILIVNTKSDMYHDNKYIHKMLSIITRQLEYQLLFLEELENDPLTNEELFNYYIRNNVYNHYKNIIYSISYIDIINENKNNFDIYNINLVSILIAVNNVIEYYLELFKIFLIRSDQRLNN